jgi:hypothetical protein
MASEKVDGVIEAVRYSPDGKIASVRVYERRGPIFSDRLLLTRLALIDRLKAGKVFVAGKRKPFLAGTFDLFGRVRLVHNAGQEVWVGGDGATDRDQLKDVPLF